METYSLVVVELEQLHGVLGWQMVEGRM